MYGTVCASVAAAACPPVVAASKGLLDWFQLASERLSDAVWRPNLRCRRRGVGRPLGRCAYGAGVVGRSGGGEEVAYREGTA